MAEGFLATNRLPFPCYCGVPLAISAHPSGNTLQHCVDLRRACRVFTCWTTGPTTLGCGLRRVAAVTAPHNNNFDNDANPAVVGGNSEDDGELLTSS